MAEIRTTVLLLVALQLQPIRTTDSHLDILINKPGHLKPFGFGENHQIVNEINGFPFTRHFFENYATASEPLLMKGAAKLSVAYSQWTDEYFQSIDEPDTVNVETRKKENRTVPSVRMTLKDFLSVYQTADQYMVDLLPTFLAKDVMLPKPLQCPQLRDEMIVDCVMWFSSGGTKSVVHTDAVDNINCVFRGEKHFVLIDPRKYVEKWHDNLDHPEQAYSGLDVDRVDFTKYPALAEVEYYHVYMDAGDCLFIPYRWIHQVASYQSNIAVNIWWDNHLAADLDLDQCPDTFDPNLTMDKVHILGYEALSMFGQGFKDNFLDYAGKQPLNFQHVLHFLIMNIEEVQEKDYSKEYELPIRKIFLMLDHDSNQLVTTEEIQNTVAEDWNKIMDYWTEFDLIMAASEKQWDENHGEADEMDNIQEKYISKDEF